MEHSIGSSKVIAVDFARRRRRAVTPAPAAQYAVGVAAGGWAWQEPHGAFGGTDEALIYLSDPYQRSAFIEDFLTEGGYEASEENHRLVNLALNGYRGPVPVRRAALVQFLHRKFVG